MDLVRLKPIGSQPITDVSSRSLVWYVAYGSNTLRRRLLAYIEGTDGDGPFGVHTGGRSPSPPRADRPVQLRHEIYFAGHSVRWDGPVAFVDPSESDDAVTHARAYLLQWQQIEDLIAHENGHGSIPAMDRLPDVRDTSPLPVDGKYNLLLRLRDLDGRPAVTLTTSSSFERGTPPTAYFEVLKAGLRETLAYAEAELESYVRRLDALAGLSWTGSNRSVT